MLIWGISGAAFALALSWLAVAVAFLVLRPPGGSPRDAARVFPDALRLARGLYRDPSVPRSARWRLRLAVLYNLQPINLIPDFVPVLGFVDNLTVIAWALRSTLRRAGPEAIRHHWRGTPEGLAVLCRLAGLGIGAADADDDPAVSL